MDITTGFEYVNDDDNNESICTEGAKECETNLLTAAQLQESPFTNLARYVAKEREAVMINHEADYKNGPPELLRLLLDVAKKIPKMNQFLSLPIYNAQSSVVGVVQLLNKVNNKPFTSSDKSAVESFALFCGMAIHNTQTYEEVSKLSAKQKVAIECLSFHSRPNEDEVEMLENDVIPSTEFFNLTRFHPATRHMFFCLDFKITLYIYRYDFIDFELSDYETCKVVIRMFLHCDLINIFRIPYQVYHSIVLKD